MEISSARENYREAAARAAVLYFILNDLHKINPMYQFSLKAFSIVFLRAIEKTPVKTFDDEEEERPSPAELLKERVADLTEAITYQTMVYTTRGTSKKLSTERKIVKRIRQFCGLGLFEKDKFIFKVLVTFKILQHSGEIDRAEMDFLMKCPSAQDAKTPAGIDFLTDAQWGSLKVH